MNKEETWKAVPGFAGVDASDDGRIRVDGIIRKLFNSHGYSALNVRKNQRMFAHRLVCFAFLDNPECKPHVNHKNGVKHDNRLANLEWCTRSENLTHSCRVLKKHSGEKCHFASLSENDVLDIKALRFSGARSRDLAESYGVNQSTISRIFTNFTWKTSCMS